MTAKTTTQAPNYRIYDRTGGDVTNDIYAEDLAAAISAGRAWIEAGSWGSWGGGDSRNDEGFARQVTMDLECEVGPIIYTDGTIDEESTDDQDREDCSGTYTDDKPDCLVDEGWDFVSIWDADMDDFGCRSIGGTGMKTYEVCRNTGVYRDSYTPGSQRNPDEPSEVITWRAADEQSLAYIREYHAEGDGNLPEWLTDYLEAL